MMKESYSYVICENENQVYDIRLTFKKQSKNSALKVPKIETLDIWLANAYQDYLLKEITHEELYLLNGIEEKIIWEKIIKNDLKKIWAEITSEACKTLVMSEIDNWYAVIDANGGPTKY